MNKKVQLTLVFILWFCASKWLESQIEGMPWAPVYFFGAVLLIYLMGGFKL